MKRGFVILMLVAVCFIPLLSLAGDSPDLSGQTGSLISGLRGLDNVLFITGAGGYGERYASGVDGNGDMLMYVIGMVLRAVLSLLGVVFLGLMVYGGFIWFNARGREEEVDRAKDTITYSIIGIGIVLASFAISYAVSWVYYNQVIPQ